LPDLSTSLITVLNDWGVASADKIEPLTDLIGLVGDIGGTIGGINSIVQFVLSLQGNSDLQVIKNDIDQFSQRVQNDFKQLGLDEGASQMLNRTTWIDIDVGLQKDAITQYQWLTDFLRKGGDGRQLTSDERDNHIGPCASTLNAMGGDSDIVWNLTFDWRTFWTDAGLFTNTCYRMATISIDAGYGQEAPGDADANGNVFNYTVTFPYYLDAVAIFLAVAGSIDPAFPSSRRSTLEAIAAVLTKRYGQIMSAGLKALSPPDWTSAGIVQITCPGGWAAQVGIRLIYKEPVDPNAPVIQGALIEYGVVEKYSGCSSVGFDYRIDFDSNEDQTNPAIFHKLQLRLWRRAQMLFDNIGLPGVWKAINSVNSLLGSPLLDKPTMALPDGTRIDLTQWSFRRIVEMFKLGPATSASSLRALATLIIGTKPLDTPYTNAPAGTAISFRQLLENSSA
jgi:hypothetical protein